MDALIQNTINIGDKTIICIGDVHGDFQILRYRLKEWITKYNLHNVAFVVLGDCGFLGKKYDVSWFNRERNTIIKILKESDNDLYLFRGNHDNPDIFNSEYILKGLTGNHRIHVLLDYDVITGDRYGSILIVPGAFSIDRSYREEGRSWWRNETVVKLNDKTLFGMQQYDIVLSHSLPYYNDFHSDDQLKEFWAHDVRVFANDGEDSFYHMIDNEKNYLIKLQESIHAQLWVSGHYHHHFDDEKDGVTYISIGIMEFFLLPELKKQD